MLDTTIQFIFYSFLAPLETNYSIFQLTSENQHWIYFRFFEKLFCNVHVSWIFHREISRRKFLDMLVDVSKPIASDLDPFQIQTTRKQLAIGFTQVFVFSCSWTRLKYLCGFPYHQLCTTSAIWPGSPKINATFMSITPILKSFFGLLFHLCFSLLAALASLSTVCTVTKLWPATFGEASVFLGDVKASAG